MNKPTAEHSDTLPRQCGFCRPLSHPTPFASAVSPQNVRKRLIILTRNMGRKRSAAWFRADPFSDLSPFDP
jgi:hypothetical protein